MILESLTIRCSRVLALAGIPYVAISFASRLFWQSGMQVGDTEVVLPAFESMRQVDVATMQLFAPGKFIGMTAIRFEIVHGVL